MKKTSLLFFVFLLITVAGFCDFCFKCGTELKETASFCSKCGIAVSGQSTASGSVTTAAKASNYIALFEIVDELEVFLNMANYQTMASKLPEYAIKMKRNVEEYNKIEKSLTAPQNHYCRLMAVKFALIGQIFDNWGKSIFHNEVSESLKFKDQLVLGGLNKIIAQLKNNISKESSVSDAEIGLKNLKEKFKEYYVTSKYLAIVTSRGIQHQIPRGSYFIVVEEKGDLVNIFGMDIPYQADVQNTVLENRTDWKRKIATKNKIKP